MAVAALAAGLAVPASALQIEITGGGADRLERQRAWAKGELPLPGTPELSKLAERLGSAGLKEGAAVFVRIFKAESELELWMQKGREFKRFATYPICQWSGVLGPKMYEGDNQSPEGFYTMGRRELKWQTRHHRAFDLRFPNAFDRAHGRTGSNILVHGGCSTEGCFAMTNPVIDEIFRLANSAIASGQKDIHVHVFPFRMTDENLIQHSASPWLDFWINLKTGYDLFAETRVPPVTGMCKARYSYDRVPEFGAIESERDCDAPAAANSSPVPPPASIVTTGSLRATAATPGSDIKPVSERKAVNERKASRRSVKARGRDGQGDTGAAADDAPVPQVQTPSGPMGSQLLPGRAPAALSTPARAAALPPAPIFDAPLLIAPPPVAPLAPMAVTTTLQATPLCDAARPSCRKWLALQVRKDLTQVLVRPAAPLTAAAGARRLAARP